MKIERSRDPALFLSKKEKDMITRAVRDAERETSGEIRVHLERQINGEILARGREIFEKIGMARTAARNGVLILLGVRSRRFVILGDLGIHEKVSPGYWDDAAQEMAGFFREDRFGEGIAAAVKNIGKKLKDFFPYERNDLNELPDEISYSL